MWRQSLIQVIVLLSFSLLKLELIPTGCKKSLALKFLSSQVSLRAYSELNH